MACAPVRACRVERRFSFGPPHSVFGVDDDRLSDTFAALANTTRRAILARLAEGEANVNELAEPFALTLPAV
jgi:DNA-binding transcriptional ArsR family regulator